MRLKGKYLVRKKVVFGFVLAFILVLGVSTVTYFSIRNLLDTVEDLTQPNEKLQQLNGLMADVYVLDFTKTERTSDKDSVAELARKRVKERLVWLKLNSTDSAEIGTYEELSLTISELMVVFAGLEEVRNYLANRNFSAEALKGIEIRIKRQQELSDMQFLGKLRTKELLSSLSPKTLAPDSVGPEINDLGEEIEFDIQNELIEIADDIKKSEKVSFESLPIQYNDQDSTLLAIRKSVEIIFKDEQRLQNRFLRLEANLIEKNTAVFSQIQSIVSDLQTEVLDGYKSQTNSAYKLTYSVSWILGALVFLGVIGSLGFAYSILKEVDKENLYREKLEEAKKYSDKLAKAKQDFLSNMSHEIRNPLHVIQGYQEALGKSNLIGQQKEFVKRIGFASDTLKSVVNDILDFSKLEASQIKIVQEPFEPVGLFLSIKNSFALKAEEKTLFFNWKLEIPQGKWLLGDELRINQIMNNLLGNSFKFTQNGGINVHVIWEKNNLYIKIADSGMGMTQEIRKNIFKEFNQGDSAVNRKFGGTGLGLAIVKKLVDKLEGTILVESEVDKGTVISFVLPCPSVNPRSVEADQTSDYSLRGFNVLLVDDDPLGLQLLKLVFENHGANVTDIQGGEVFLEQFIPLEFDVAIIDIQMPKVSGLEVIKLIKSNIKYKNLPVIAITANVFVEEERKLLEHGFDGLLLKPFNETEIINKVGLVLGLSPIPSKQISKVKVDPDLVQDDYDLSDLMRFCMGDREMLIEVIQDFVNATNGDLRGLKSSLQKSDFEKVMEIVHRMSSRLGQLKIRTCQLAMEIERDLKRGKNIETALSIEKLVMETNQVLVKIQADWLLEAAQ
ncbi:ATP-binding protein [Aquiflexum gelatinilyticum]|uniref:hybrid sensor histidine kinase/response regulator n=1 Tax=Aquiflexum gelatinilyticum TaxID=2961943 RepID=UPI002167694B|nr:ATP-binding protein [Aquiflexum gelatinilyticum]MCS4433595.1 ATP-binding protein [Aquiflexum gelatinilyticum]